MSNPLKITLFILLIIVVVLYFENAARKFKLEDKIETVGLVVEKHFNSKRSSTAEIHFADHNGHVNEVVLHLSSIALRAIPNGYPYSIRYSKENLNKYVLDKFVFPKGLLDSFGQSVPGKIVEINKNIVYGLNFKFRGFWEVICEYSVGGINYQTLLLLDEKPKFAIGDEFYVKYNVHNPKIGYLDITQPISFDAKSTSAVA